MSESLWLARRDRLGLCDLLDELGPDAPTLCEGWSTRDLAAHLVARDRGPTACPGWSSTGSTGGPSGSGSERPSARTRSWSPRLRAGPPSWSPLALPRFDRLGNTHEFFVHFEDVRRAETGWTARALDDDGRGRSVEGRSAGSVAGRSRPRRSASSCNGRTARSSAPRAATPTVTITGPPGELLLYAFGREDHALVDLDGAPAEAVGRARLRPNGPGRGRGSVRRRG